MKIGALQNYPQPLEVAMREETKNLRLKNLRFTIENTKQLVNLQLKNVRFTIGNTKQLMNLRLKIQSIYIQLYKFMKIDAVDTTDIYSK